MPAAAPEPSATLTARYRLDRVEDWEIFLRRLRRRDSFAFLPLFAPEDAGVEIARRAFADWAEKNAVPVVFHTLVPDGPADSLTRLLIDGLEKPDAIHWIQASPLDPRGDKESQLAARWHDPVAALNSRRNTLQQSLRTPLIFAAPEELSPYLRDHAVDLWDIRGISTYLPPPETDLSPASEAQSIDSSLAIPGDLEFTLSLARDLEGQPERAEERAALLSRAGRQALHHWNLPLADSLLRSSLKLSQEADSGPETLYQREADLTRFLSGAGQVAEALTHAVKAREHAEFAYGINSAAYASTLNDMAGLLKALNKTSEAEVHYRRALAISEIIFGNDHPETATRLNNLALLLQGEGRLEEAESLFRRAMFIDEAKLGINHPAYAAALNNLAGLLHVQGKLAQAEPLFQKAIKIGEECWGAGHPRLAVFLNNLGNLLQDQGRAMEAEPLYHKAIAISQSTLGKNHPDVATWLNNLAAVKKAQGKLAEALVLSRKHLLIFFYHRKLNGTPFEHEQQAITNYTRLLEETHHTPDQIQAEIAALRREAGLD